MPVLDATPSGPSANSYLTVVEADDLMEMFDQMDAWDELDPDAQAQLLMEGTRIIDAYKRWGPRKKSDQRLAFPRASDKEGIVPEEVRLALVEYLNYKLEGGLVPIKKLQAEGVTSASVLGQTSSFKEDSSRLPAGARNLLDELWQSHWPLGHENPPQTPGQGPGGFFHDEH